MYAMTRKKDELIQTVNIMMKLQHSKARFYETVERKFYENRRDYDTAIVYAFYHYYEISSILQGEDLAQYSMLQSEEIYNELLLEDEEDWFVHLLNLFLLRKLAFTENGSQKYYIEIRKMLKLQANADKVEAYYIIPFVSLSEFHMNEGKLEEAEQDLKLGLESSIQERICFTGVCVHIRMMLQEMEYHAKTKGSVTYISLLKYIRETYFGI